MTSSWASSTNETESDLWWRCSSGWRSSRYHCIRKRHGSNSVASRWKIERVAGLVDRKRSTSLGSLTSAAGPAGVSVSLNGRHAGTGCEQGCESSKKSSGGACTNQFRFRVSAWDMSSRGYFAHHAVPTNSRCLGAFRHYVVDLWRRSLARRSQRDHTTWNRMVRLAAEFLTPPHILHPWPSVRFAVKHHGGNPMRELRPPGSVQGGAAMRIPPQ